jgi:PAS domain S-box-containing protein
MNPPRDSMPNVADSIADSIFWIDRTARIVFVNKAACRNLGYSREELQSMAVFDVDPAFPRDAWDAHWEDMLTRGSFAFETVHQTKDGRRLAVDVTVNRAEIEGELYNCAVARDITDRKRVETELAAETARRRALFEQSPDGILIIDPRTAGFIEFNTAAHRQLGYSREEFAKLTIFDVEARETAEETRAQIGNVMRHGKADFETLQRTRDGETRRVHVTAQLVDVQGEPIYHCVWRDITDRKRAEEALRSLATDFSSLSGRLFFEAVSRHIGVALDVDYVFVGRLNADQRSVSVLGGYARGAAMDDLTYGLAGTPCDGVAGKEVRVYPSGVQTLFPEDGLLGQLGVEGYIGAPIFDKAHAPLGVLVALHSKRLTNPQVGTDLFSVFLDRVAAEMQRTEADAARELLREQLTQAQKMESVGRLAGGVAHDFNNMLGVILGHAEMAMEQVAPSQPVYSDLEEIQKAARRSADLTRQLLAFARKQTVAPELLDLNAAIESARRALRSRLGEHIDLQWKPGAGLGPVRVDPAQFDQVLTSLCVNAGDAIGPRIGRVTLETSMVDADDEFCARHADARPGRYVLLTVTDDGCGMDEETREHVFEPFFTTKGAGEGTGLGLATVYGAVRQNGGFIDLESAPGRGTTFSLYFPTHTARTLVGPARPQAEAARGHETILLVEDEPAILQMTRAMLERQGYVVLAASAPDDAIRLAQSAGGRIDLLVTDVMMPRMNGPDLAAHLASVCPSLRCLFISGHTAGTIAHHGVLGPGAHFVQKPYSMADLAANVRAVLALPAGTGPASAGSGGGGN